MSDIFVDAQIAGLATKRDVYELAAASFQQANTFVGFGDSIEAQVHAGATGVTLQRVASLVTATHPGHQFSTVSRIHVEKMNDPSFNGYQTVTRTGPNTYTYPQAGPDGVASGGIVRNTKFKADTGWLTWFGIHSDQKLQMIYNGGVGGDRVEQMLARIQADVIDRAPGWCIVGGGINNINTAQTAVEIFSTIKEIYRRLRAVGIRVVACTLLPPQTGHVNALPANIQKILAVNALIRTEARNNPGIILFDRYFLFVNSNVTTGVAKAGLVSPDNLHPSPAGCAVLGRGCALVLNPYLVGSPSVLPMSAADNISVDPANRRIWQWLPNVGAGGTIGPGVVGAAPAGLQVKVLSGAPTVVASAPQRSIAAGDADDIGFNCAMSFQANAAGDSARAA